MIDFQLDSDHWLGLIRNALAKGPGLRLLHQEIPDSLAVSSFFHVELAIDGASVCDATSPLFHDTALLEVAKQLHGLEEVRAHSMFAHLTPPGQRLHPHTDHPVFVGADPKLQRWLTALMHRSGLFEDRRLPVATAVCFFDSRPDGTTCFWPDGVTGAPVERSVRPGSATMFDADSITHAVSLVTGESELRLTRPEPGIRLHADDDQWFAHRGRSVFGTWGWSDLRLSVVWKGVCGSDPPQSPDERPPLDHALVVSTLRTELARTELVAADAEDREVLAVADRVYAATLPSWPLAKDSSSVVASANQSRNAKERRPGSR